MNEVNTDWEKNLFYILSPITHSNTIIKINEDIFNSDLKTHVYLNFLYINRLRDLEDSNQEPQDIVQK